jgi:anti-anti-sigma regulatory factor
MFRVTVHDDPRCLTFQVEGRLAGPWVRELHDCWRSTLAGQSRPAVCVDLAGVTFVDAAGRALLAQLHRAGAQLRASGVQMRAVVAEISQDPAGTPQGDRGTEGGARGDR